MDWREYIEQKPEVMLGKPVIKGTRLTVEFILDRLGQGWAESELLKSFPQLRVEHIRAVQAFAAAYLSLDQIVFEPASEARASS